MLMRESNWKIEIYRWRKYIIKDLGRIDVIEIDFVLLGFGFFDEFVFRRIKYYIIDFIILFKICVYVKKL